MGFQQFQRRWHLNHALTILQHQEVEVTRRMGPRVAVRIISLQVPPCYKALYIWKAHTDLTLWYLEQIAWASYINPGGDPASWNRLIGYPASKMPVLVANVANGPDSTVDAGWTDVITRGTASGKTMLGYVRTGYLGVSDQKFTTRLGSGNLADWAAQIEQDVNMWYTLYPNIGGIFFDEGWPECGASNQYVELYKYINDYTKRAHPGALTVLNPGSPMASCFEDTMDTLLTFELNYTSYMNSYTPNDWVPKDPRKLWHIIYNVDASEVANVVALAEKRGAGFVQVTDGVMPNPYDTLPSDSYIQSELGAVMGGVPLNTAASDWASGVTAGAVGSLTLTASDYSSASLSWTAATTALGYYVYMADSTLVASLPSSMTSVTIGGLTPSTTYEFHVLPVGSGGNTGFSSNRVTVYTKPLPGGLTITNYAASPLAGSTTYHADILVPYAFVHLYIWDSIECEFDTNPGWPINFVVDDYVCTHYMVENLKLYKYTGTVPAGTTAAPWTWTEIGDVTRVITGYTYTWTLPIGTLTTDTSKFVVQVQGYNPYGTVFEPDPHHYDCKGSSMCTTPGLLAWCDTAVNHLGRNDSLSYATTS
jgi:Spherulation-specific family 4/Fibronectin type III domain